VAYQYQVVNLTSGDWLLKGGIPRILKRGPRKGQKTWDRPLQTVVVTTTERDTELARYEKETNNCCNCCGTGERLRKFSVETGKIMRPCQRCDGTGKAPVSNGYKER